jgi:hypothetical protein
VFRYRLLWADGDDAGEAEYAVYIRPDDIIHALDGSKLRVLDLVVVSEEDSPYDGLLRVETTHA